MLLSSLRVRETCGKHTPVWSIWLPRLTVPKEVSRWFSYSPPLSFAQTSSVARLLRPRAILGLDPTALNGPCSTDIDLLRFSSSLHSRQKRPAIKGAHNLLAQLQSHGVHPACVPLPKPKGPHLKPAV